jgi:hypothetical protein
MTAFWEQNTFSVSSFHPVQSISLTLAEKSESELVLFHCLGALRNGLLRQWHTLPRDVIYYLRSYLLNYLGTNFRKD